LVAAVGTELHKTLNIINKKYKRLMLITIKQRLKKYSPQSDNSEFSDVTPKAAVLLLLHGDPDNPQVILTRRANHLSSHAGEVAFPGGMKDKKDNDLLATALRETQEEIGLASSKINILGSLPTDSPQINTIRVAPFMGWVDTPFRLTPDPSEIASVFNFPLSFLLDKKHYQYFCLAQGKIELPYVQYKNYKIWGFTLKVMVDMLNSTLDAKIKLRYPSRKQLENLG
jgi:8-oxo-dGTP pyrophosphatase MutT (NUDIX family)